MNNTDYKDLEEKSFCVIKNFINTDELKLIEEDFELIKESSFINPNFNIFPVGKKVDLTDVLENNVGPLYKEISEHTYIKTNYICTPTYFSTKHGVNFGYHQDHDSWFLYGDHTNYLNIWVPIIKPSIELSNVTVINFRKLFKDHPELKFLKSYGATRAQGGAESGIADDNCDKIIMLDFDLDDYSETPQLEAGDALVMRGDSLHKTQDVLTDRVAISIRCLNTESKVQKSHFEITSSKKKELIESNPEFYKKITDKFATVNECTIGDLL